MAQGRILRRAGLAVSLGIAALLLSGCSIDNEVLRFGWPSGITPEATRMRELWTWSVVAALVMGVLVWGLIFWAVIFHRKKKDSPEFPRQTAYNVPLELGLHGSSVRHHRGSLLLHRHRAEPCSGQDGQP